MILIFCFFPLILLIKQLHGAYYLVVSFKHEIGRSLEDNCWFYKEKRYKKYLEMADRIRKDFKFFPKKNLLGFIDTIIYWDRVLKVEDTRKYSNLTRDYYNPDFTLPLSEIPIKTTNIFSKTVYICNESSFKNFKDAKKCVDDLHKFSKIKVQFLKSISKNGPSMNIWVIVWQKCYYECFTKNEYKKLKLNLNMLRKMLHLHPLRYSKYLDVYASRRALLRFGVDTHLIHINKDKSAKEISATIDAPYASTQMNNWFNLYFNQNSQGKSNKRYRNKFNLLNLLFSNVPKEVGFGVDSIGDKIYIACNFK